ncbi:unnamed protein product [Vitrella brassicaformis CCMP3155]|uniref:Uncharacterized protein n=1 Tax=Vitrella brassicaformis (strain CCMP3155) TaxID=1169540 RepID=A0A0G4GFW2_VITBC|nr:unnamed protein product [Vitrella brassicaformis CCMP3155]|eukprot:CEM28404.1 unnamed protein product [Vitrella brassicaformis CCMP3155]
MEACEDEPAAAATFSADLIASFGILYQQLFTAILEGGHATEIGRKLKEGTLEPGLENFKSEACDLPEAERQAETDRAQLMEITTRSAIHQATIDDFKRQERQFEASRERAAARGAAKLIGTTHLPSPYLLREKIFDEEELEKRSNGTAVFTHFSCVPSATCRQCCTQTFPTSLWSSPPRPTRRRLSDWTRWGGREDVCESRIRFPGSEKKFAFLCENLIGSTLVFIIYAPSLDLREEVMAALATPVDGTVPLQGMDKRTGFIVMDQQQSAREQTRLASKCRDDGQYLPLPSGHILAKEIDAALKSNLLAVDVLPIPNDARVRAPRQKSLTKLPQSEQRGEDVYCWEMSQFDGGHDDQKPALLPYQQTADSYTKQIRAVLARANPKPLEWQMAETALGKTRGCVVYVGEAVEGVIALLTAGCSRVYWSHGSRAVPPELLVCSSATPPHQTHHTQNQVLHLLNLKEDHPGSRLAQEGVGARPRLVFPENVKDFFKKHYQMTEPPSESVLLGGSLEELTKPTTKAVKRKPCCVRYRISGAVGRSCKPALPRLRGGRVPGLTCSPS